MGQPLPAVTPPATARAKTYVTPVGNSLRRLNGPDRYTATVAAAKSPLRERFEAERRRSAFFSFLLGAGSGIIVADTWLSPYFGVAGGVTVGAVAYSVVYLYETWMWRRHHGH